jgi:hypothetical protein
MKCLHRKCKSTSLHGTCTGLMLGPDYRQDCCRYWPTGRFCEVMVLTCDVTLVRYCKTSQDGQSWNRAIVTYRPTLYFAGDVSGNNAETIWTVLKGNYYYYYHHHHHHHNYHHHSCLAFCFFCLIFICMYIAFIS